MDMGVDVRSVDEQWINKVVCNHKKCVLVII